MPVGRLPNSVNELPSAFSLLLSFPSPSSHESISLVSWFLEGHDGSSRGEVGLPSSWKLFLEAFNAC